MLRSSTLGIVVLIGVLRVGPVVGQERIWERGHWDRIGGVLASDSSPILNPALIAAAAGRVYVVDYGDQSIKAFSPDGRLQWSFGRKGKGPGEFLNAADIGVDPLGYIWVADPVVSRITVVTPDGKLGRTEAQSLSAFRAEPNDSATFWLWRPLKPFLSVGRLGEDAAREIPEPAELHGVEPFVRDLFLTKVADNRAAVVYRWSSQAYFVTSDGSVERSFVLVERGDFPKMVSREVKTKIGIITRVGPDPKAREIAAGIARCEGRIAVLSLSGEGQERVIDYYGVTNGEYLGSRKMPEEVAQIECNGESLIGLVRDPAPAIEVWRWTAE